jgi:hypothetical protein
MVHVQGKALLAVPGRGEMRGIASFLTTDRRRCSSLLFTGSGHATGATGLAPCATGDVDLFHPNEDYRLSRAVSLTSGLSRVSR